MNIPEDVYESLEEFIYQRESDIEDESENFDILAPVLAWIRARQSETPIQ